MIAALHRLATTADRLAARAAHLPLKPDHLQARASEAQSRVFRAQSAALTARYARLSANQIAPLQQAVDSLRDALADAKVRRAMFLLEQTCSAPCRHRTNQIAAFLRLTDFKQAKCVAYHRPRVHMHSGVCAEGTVAMDSAQS